MTFGTLTSEPSEPSSPVSGFILNDDEVHVWQVRLDVHLPEIANWRSVLSADEQARAERYRFARDRHRYIVRRLVLRKLLAGYLEAAPEKIQFAYGPAGKPFLAKQFENAQLSFSLSQSDEFAVYAFTRSRSIGVDIERIRPDIIDEFVAERFFSPAEAASLRALPRSLQPRAFFASWTQKEACVKARGDGIASALDRFEVSVSPDGPFKLIKVAGDSRQAAKWSLHRLSPRADFVAALAIEAEGGALRILCRTWPMRNRLAA
jgi:4'-phosphopantetheinyl transferase